MTTELDMDGNTIQMGGTGEVGGGDGEGVYAVNFEDITVSEVSCSSSDDQEGRLFYDGSQGGLYLCKNGNKVAIADEANKIGGAGRNLVSDGAYVSKPACSKGNPQVYTTPSLLAEGAESGAIHAVQTWAEDSGDEWRIRLRVLTQDGWIHPPSEYGKVFVVKSCE